MITKSLHFISKIPDLVRVTLVTPLLYEERSQVGIPHLDRLPLFGKFRTYMSQSVEKYLDVVGARLIVCLKTDDSYF